MRQINIIFLAVIFIIFSSTNSIRQFDLKDIPTLDKNIFSQNEDNEIRNIPYDQFIFENSETLQITQQKIVAMLTGLKKDSQYRYIQQFVVYNSEGKQTASKIFKDAEKQTSSTLSLTNIRGEFVHIVNRFFGIYITMYDENLNVTRNVENQLLEGFEDFYGFHNPIISVGKNLMYIAINLEDYEGIYYKRVYVLDLSEKSALKLIQIYTYDDQPDYYLFAHSIQAFKDGSSIMHYYNANNNGYTSLVQIKYDQNGDEVLGYPKEINLPINVYYEYDQGYYYDYEVSQHWYTYLNEDGKTATFLASDQYEQLLIYTFNKDGETICSKINYIYDFDLYSYYYGILGNQGWIYFLEYYYGQGYLGFFNSNECSLNYSSFVITNNYGGLAGSLIDGENKQVLIYLFGNSQATYYYDEQIQNTYQVLLYNIGSYEGEEDFDFLDLEGEDEGENSGFIDLE
ncbi:hypothetical protein PPERSA_03386 [Pseudocohnilembus persalinus]|uniref:Uncharacterized protein n=1 Tax=Pseudocohnilembus persalinus TaxID=266149 RepID=A0A0V0QM91_PSEPJ|nr:hypothetical protein PPERSA_03386 [Pseudocohnilembus persalinus]|eukprot:KRX03271.1 hypothetical protein PPERSA_03386 [Pseudocohnilembus persalinus]